MLLTLGLLLGAVAAAVLAVGTRSSAPPQAAERPRARAVPILLYHRIEAVAGVAHPELYVRPSDFAAQMRWLADRGYRAVTLERVYRSWRGTAALPDRPVVISFDDGYRSVYTHALPILRSLQWPGVLCLTAANLGSQLLPRHVRALIAAGWEVEPHTLTHPDLTQVSRRRLEREVAGSRAVIRRRLRVPARFFCYPYGRYDARVVEAVRAAGYLDAASSDYGLAAPQDRFVLKRIGIERNDRLVGMVQKVEGAFVEFRARRLR